MVFYIIVALIVLTIFIYLITEFIHLPKKKFKKNLKIRISNYTFSDCFLFNEIFFLG